MAQPKRDGWNRGLRGGFGRAGFRGGRAGVGIRGGRGGESKQCWKFRETGSCPNGNRCTYSHDLSSGLSSGPSMEPRRVRPEPTPEQEEAQGNYNSWKRLIKRQPTANDTRTIEQIWNGALTILDGNNRDCKHMLPRDLDDESNYGREHILTLLTMVALPHGHSKFVDLVRPFLSVISHPALLDSLSVDTFVGGLYNFISGSNGTRAIPFFRRLSMSLLGQHAASITHTPCEELERALIAMSTTLRELLRREQRATFNEDLPELVSTMESVVGGIGIGPHSMTFQIVNNIIGEVRGMIGRAKGLLQPEKEPEVGGVSTTTVVTSTYPRYLILPRDRHDNDKLDITKIQIIPTEDEIRSDHADFLPSTDFDQPHFLTDSAERHLDTNFRLLRHDIFGELSEALSGAMLALDNDQAVIKDPKSILGNIRAYPNPGAHIRYVSFDRRRGLEVQISFPQPVALRKKSAAERSKWWEDSKRLEEGVLLCLLFAKDAKSSLLFFTVSEKCIDTRKDDGLTHNQHQATIKAKLATRSQDDFEKMTGLSCQNKSGLLVEFPGVLLATFVPVLESIQKMHRLSQLPFRQWILPDRVSSQGSLPMTVDIPPPLYARSPGFTFSLNSILKDPSGEMSLTTTMLADINRTVDALEAQTELDRGQCQALIAAFTREFAFIQGPPGTGKSYLGVQLMKVLLNNKKKADLGPIVVV